MEPSSSQKNQRIEPGSSRKRKTHTKSRRGCIGCKLRRVKCDEAQPTCRKCASFGVVCKYGTAAAVRTADLHAACPGTFLVHLSPPPSIPRIPTFLGSMDISVKGNGDQPGMLCEHQVTWLDMEILQRFTSRTVFSLGDGRTQHVYRAAFSSLVCHHPFLFHAALAMTMFHDRLMGPSPQSQPSQKELLHQLRGTKLLNSKLGGALTSAERDGLWIASILLGAISLATVEGERPEDVWPMSCSPMDLNWVGMAEGKRELWRMTDLPRPGSSLNGLVEIDGTPCTDKQDQPGLGLKQLPQALLDLLQLRHADSGACTNGRRNCYGCFKNNPYLPIADLVGQLVMIECTEETKLRFFAFLGIMTPEFRALLHAKDPGALILLGYWWEKMKQQDRWWTWHRASLESQSIWLYLQRHHARIPHLKEILRFPRMAISERLDAMDHWAANEATRTLQGSGSCGGFHHTLPDLRNLFDYDKRSTKSAIGVACTR